MDDVSVKIIKLNQEQSSYYDNDDYGTFVFELSDQVEERWMDIFSSKVSLREQSFYKALTPDMIGNRKISAVAEIEGRHGINNTLMILKEIISLTNHVYNEELRDQQKRKNKEDERRINLDKKVKNIIDYLDF